MADRVDEETRSEMMSSIRGTGNASTEWAMRARLVAEGISGFTLHADLPGSPDFAFGDERVAVFVDGCFWHGCPEHHNQPDNNSEFWAQKIQGNRDRDRRVTEELEGAGWTVIRIWEHELANAPETAVERVREAVERCRREKRG